MSTTTTLLSLTKPDGSDAALISVINANMDILDNAVTLTGTQTLTNKTFTSPHMTTPVVDSGGLTITTGGLTITAGGLTITAGGATISAGGIKIAGSTPTTSGSQVGLGFTFAATGGGSTATLGTIGGSGPATAAMNQWWKINANGADFWIPIWQ